MFASTYILSYEFFERLPDRIEKKYFRSVSSFLSVAAYADPYTCTPLPSSERMRDLYTANKDVMVDPLYFPYKYLRTFNVFLQLIKWLLILVFQFILQSKCRPENLIEY